MIVVEYKLEVWFVVDNEIHYGDVGHEDMGAAMLALLGDKFGPKIDILHGNLEPDKRRWDHDTLRVTHKGMHRRAPVNPVPPSPPPGWHPVDDVEFTEVPVTEDTAAGMHDDQHIDDTMERFITITDDIKKEEKEKKQKKKPKHRGGYNWVIKDRKGRRHKARHKWRRGKHREGRTPEVLAIEAQPKRKELE